MNDVIVTDCYATAERCLIYRPGHRMNAIQAAHLGRRPWGWRDAIVVDSVGTLAEVQLLEDGSVFQAWHHRVWSTLLVRGAPVQVHFGAGSVLRGGFGIASITHNCPLGPVPRPEHPDLWAAEATPLVVNTATGYGASNFPSR